MKYTIIAHLKPLLLFRPRVPAAWGVMKHLQKKIPETASKKSQMYGDLIEQDKYGLET